MRMRVYIVYSYRAAQSYIAFRNFSLKREWKSNVRRDSMIWKKVEKRRKRTDRRRRRRQRRNICVGQRLRGWASRSCFRSHRSFLDRQGRRQWESLGNLDGPWVAAILPRNRETDVGLSAIQDWYTIELSIYLRVFTISVGPLTLSWTLVIKSYRDLCNSCNLDSKWYDLW